MFLSNSLEQPSWTSHAQLVLFLHIPGVKLMVHATFIRSELPMHNWFCFFIFQEFNSWSTLRLFDLPKRYFMTFLLPAFISTSLQLRSVFPRPVKINGISKSPYWQRRNFSFHVTLSLYFTSTSSMLLTAPKSIHFDWLPLSFHIYFFSVLRGLLPSRFTLLWRFVGRRLCSCRRSLMIVDLTFAGSTAHWAELTWRFDDVRVGFTLPIKRTLIDEVTKIESENSNNNKPKVQYLSLISSLMRKKMGSILFRMLGKISKNAVKNAKNIP